MRGLLIANRNHDARERLAGMFDPDDYRVIQADNVANALEGIINKEVQVVVIDGDCNQQHVAKLIPLMKKCNRNISIVLVTDDMPLELVRRIRKEGIFYHAMRNAADDNVEEIYQAVCYAFKKYEDTTQLKKEKAMFPIKSVLSTIALTMMLVSPALAVDTAATYNSGILVLLFVGFCALLIVAQLVPALLMLFGMTKAVGKGLSKEKAQAAGSK